MIGNRHVFVHISVIDLHPATSLTSACFARRLYSRYISTLYHAKSRVHIKQTCKFSSECADNGSVLQVACNRCNVMDMIEHRLESGLEGCVV